MKVNEIIIEAGVWQGVKTAGRGLGQVAKGVGQAAAGVGLGTLRALDRAGGGTGDVGTAAQRAAYANRFKELAPDGAKLKFGNTVLEKDGDVWKDLATGEVVNANDERYDSLEQSYKELLIRPSTQTPPATKQPANAAPPATKQPANAAPPATPATRKPYTILKTHKSPTGNEYTFGSDTVWRVNDIPITDSNVIQKLERLAIPAIKETR